MAKEKWKESVQASMNQSAQYPVYKVDRQLAEGSKRAAALYKRIVFAYIAAGTIKPTDSVASHKT